MMKLISDLMDLPTNLENGLSVVRGIRGIPALVLGTALSFICVALGSATWYFDIEPTLDFAEPAVLIMTPVLPANLASWIPLATLSITLLPTLMELFGSVFAVRIKAAAILLYGCILMDFVTDWPRVVEFLAMYESYFNELGMFKLLVWWSAHFLLLILASFGVEMLFVVMSICAFFCFLSFGRNKGRGGRPNAAYSEM